MKAGSPAPLALRCFLFIGLLALSGCILDPGECGPIAQIPDGEYPSNDSCLPPHAEGEANGLRLRLDNEAGYVTIEYEIEEGEEIRKVEERWKIVGRNGAHWSE